MILMNCNSCQSYEVENLTHLTKFIDKFYIRQFTILQKEHIQKQIRIKLLQETINQQ